MTMFRPGPLKTKISNILLGDGKRTKTYPMLRNRASGKEISIPCRISVGFSSGKPQNRSSGRLSAGRRTDSVAFPTRIRPKSSPEARLPARRHYCVT